MDAEYSARVMGAVNPMEVKHLVDDEKAEERTHPNYFSLPEQWEYQVQQIQNLSVGEAIIRLMDDTVHKLRTPTLPSLTISRHQVQVVRDQYLTRYFAPVALPVVQEPDAQVFRRITRKPRGVL
jgi:hypothetical protein